MKLIIGNNLYGFFIALINFIAILLFIGINLAQANKYYFSISTLFLVFSLNLTLYYFLLNRSLSMFLNNIKSPLRYPGGKSRFINDLIKYIPSDFKELREPFFGSGALSLYYSGNCSIKIIGSDLNKDLYYFWYYLKLDPINLISDIKKIRYKYFNGKMLYNEIIESQKNTNISGYQRAINYYIINGITFSGTIYGGGSYSEESFQRNFTVHKINQLLLASKRMKNINLMNQDYSFLLNNNGDNVFIYIDPPYFANGDLNLYGNNNSLHKTFDHIKLFKKISKCKHDWLITYDNSQFIRDLYKDYNIYDINFNYGIKNINSNNNKKNNEIIITNYKINTRNKSFYNGFNLLLNRNNIEKRE